MANEDKLLWVRQSPISVCEGDIKSYSVLFEGATAVSSPVMAMYAGTTDVTATLIPANAPTASGNIVSCSPLVFPSNPRKEYVLVVSCSVDGNTENRKVKFLCQKKSDG
jgi:hypothetical protein